MNRLAIITGAGTELGRELAEMCCREGDFMVVCGGDSEEIRQTTTSCSCMTVLQGPLESPASAASLERLIEEQDFCEVSLINCAGLAPFRSRHDSPFGDWEHLIDANLTAAIRSVHAVLPHLLSHSGRIINVLSLTAAPYSASAAVYASARAGLLAFGRALKLEHKNAGLAVTSVIPESIDSPIFDNLLPADVAHRSISAKDAAEAIRWCMEAPRQLLLDEVVLSTGPDGVKPWLRAVA